MKRALFLVVVTGIILLVGHFLQAPAIQAGAQGGGAAAATTNGDCNGDGALNLTDAIYLLQHLFQGGPAPVPIEGSQPAPCAIPATGQTKCYDDAGSEIPCNSAEFPGQDGFYQAGQPMEDCYVDNGDGTVTDTCTGLMWQKDTADVSGDGTITDEDRLTWHEALKYCENLNFAGYSDWRLPNVRELQSIITYGRIDPALHPPFQAVKYQGGEDTWYWSSTTSIHFPDYARMVDVEGGIVASYPFRKGSVTWVRAVRGGL
jgi:hypothetical protein